MSFSEEIKRIRQKQLLSQSDLEEELGVSFTTVNRWETGKCLPSYKAMKSIDSYCKANNISYDISEDCLSEDK